MKQKMQHELIYGPHAIIEMLKAKRRRLVSIYTTKPVPKAYERIKPYLPARVPNTQYVTRDILDRMAQSEDHSGVIALVSPFVYQSKMFEPAKKKFILLLDSIQDVRNLGAILRSAYCIGVDGVVLCKRGGALLTPAVFKTSAGLAEHLDIYCANSVQQAVIEAKTNGYNLYLAVLDNGVDATTVEYTQPACLVIGNEASGIAKEAQKSGALITLPQQHADISYNASVAAGILMFIIKHAKTS